MFNKRRAPTNIITNILYIFNIFSIGETLNYNDYNFTLQPLLFLRQDAENI